MGVMQQLPFEGAINDSAGVTTGDETGYQETNSQQQATDSEFLDAVCNGVLLVSPNFKITSQNYISRANMGDLVGQCCYNVLENRSSPCDNCPHLVPSESEYETSMRCAGKGGSLYEVRIYKNTENGPEIVEVYPNMIDREILVKDLHLYREELDLLNSVVEHIKSAIADDYSEA
jgi:hypothetical protein